MQDAVGRVAAEYPCLQEEVNDLTSLLTCLMRGECLPEQGLFIESLSEDETRASSREGLKKLLGFCEISTAAFDQHSVGNIPLTGVLQLQRTEMGGVHTSNGGNMASPYEASTINPSVLDISGQVLGHDSVDYGNSEYTSSNQPGLQATLGAIMSVDLEMSDFVRNEPW